MSGFSKKMTSISSSLDKFNDQLPDLVKNMRDQLQELHRRKVIVHRRNVIDAIAEVSDAAPDAKTVDREILDAKYMPRRLISYEDFVRRRNEVFASASEALASASSILNKARASASSILNKARASAEARADADAMPLYKNQLIRWGGAALGSQVLRGAG